MPKQKEKNPACNLNPQNHRANNVSNNKNTLSAIKEDLLKLKNPQQAKILQRFFKTKKGEYGEGDIFLGIKVPCQRKISKKYPLLSLENLQKLLSGNIHEEQLTALFILIIQYKKSDESGKRKIVDFYLSNTKNINNWDLVDRL
ncbi:MAG: DNA alkylation repair protein [Candidatus Aenigmarchaeota archaeon]|nr:DNA alkylation repair protein [Candidatus Aenigmarchaeota archaeon]